MSKRKQKEIQRLLSRPSDYSYKELAKLLNDFGYIESNSGKTSGSRVRFYNPITQDKILIHRPHPSPIVKKYVIDLVIDKLKKAGEI